MARGTKRKVERLDVDVAQIEALLEKASSALEPDEIAQLRQLVKTLEFVTNELDKKRVSVKRLQRMLFGDSSERNSSPRLRKLLEQVTEGQSGVAIGAEDQEGPDETAKEPAASDTDAEVTTDDASERKGHGRRSAAEYTGAEHEHVCHPSIEPKDRCPKCPKGRLYKQKTPKVMVRLTGSAPIAAKVWSYDWFRCNLCGYIINAPLPAEAGPPEKYDESVTSTIGILRYGYGMPFNRLERLQESHNIPLPASTQWDLIERSVPTLMPVFTEFIRQAARGDVIYNDDTTARILELMAERRRAAEEGKGDTERTGTFTTGVISTVGERKIALFLTGTKHAGENLTDVLAQCEAPRDPIVQMSDGLASNEPAYLPEGLELIRSSCLTHGRRKYVEIAESFPEQCLHVIGQLQRVYRYDAQARRANMSPKERLAHHRKHSKPVMDALESWLRAQLDDKLVEPNSSFGEATRYMLTRWDRLTRFLTVPGAPLDNNICERALKRSIRHRKNSLFYKTLHGARVGDIYMSLIQTCELNGVNPFEYIKTLLVQPERDVAEQPQRWLPWALGEARTSDQTGDVQVA